MSTSVLEKAFRRIKCRLCGKVGPVIATIALVVILFESGTSLRLDVMLKSLGTTGKLTFGCFIATGAIVTAVAMLALGMPLLSALLLGAILAGTSSAVVIPMVASLRLQEAAGTVLVLESALTDVLSIVGVFALLHVVTNGDVGAGKLIGGVLASLIFAAVLGIVGGVGWLLILGKVRDFPNTISTTIAYAFLIYGLSEFLGFSGAIAAMALGLPLTNLNQRWLKKLSGVDHKIEALTPMDIAFYREAVFLLKTYFFIYLGISIQFSDSVLALIRDTAYMVVLVSIALCAVLIMAFSARPVQSLYAVMLGKRPSTGATDAQ